ncbi:GumC family protein [Stutzerimonas tarimensis]|uniref:non-specific protein-tyrosine kinase n=1 Tax=Stutzerimonas tarimensis TaxID=1507735 RepID=A0ABV7T5J6_9GAMM
MNSSVQPDRRAWHRPLGGDDNDYASLKRLWHAVWSRKWAVLLVVLVITGLTALSVMRMTPEYTAVASLKIEARNTPLITFQQTPDGATAGREYLETQLGLLRSRAVAERVVRDLNLTEHPEFDPRQAEAPLFNPSGWWSQVSGLLGFAAEETEQSSLTEAQILDSATRRFMASTRAWTEGRGQLVYLSVTMADRLTAAMAANGLADQYINSQLEARVDSSMTAATWMNSRLTELRDQLQASESRLQAYLDAEGLVDMNGVATISATELSATSDRMIDARRARAEAESQYRQVQNMQSQGWERMASVPAVLSNGLVQQFKTEVARARAQVEDLSRRYGDRHPSMQSARSDLQAATDSLRGQVEQVVASIERTYQLAVANENAIRASFDTNKEQIQSIGRKEYRVRELQREVDSNRALYETFMTRLGETTATSDLAATNATIVDRALPPTAPSAPNLSLFLAGALALSLLLGVGMAIALDVLNNTFKSADDVESNLNLPVMGIVPRVAKRHKEEVAHFFQNNADRRFCEAIRTIRTNFSLAHASHAQQMLVITSTAPGEGKSSVAANLAFAMGQLEKVLLIDADLRRPSLAKNFRFPAGTPGLANLIIGTAKVEECIQSVGNVDMLPAGTVPPNPLELLASPRFLKILEMARARYDRIIIDSPPSQAVSDAALLSTSADSVIYVIKSESTSIPQAHKGIGQMLQKGAPIAGVVLNQVDVKKLRKTQGYNGYYDHYGYSDLPDAPGAPSESGARTTTT